MIVQQAQQEYIIIIPSTVLGNAVGIPCGCSDEDIPMLLMETGFTQQIERKISEIMCTGSDVVVTVSRSRPHTLAHVPSSTELIAMAKQDWVNREERRGIHNREDWCSGWIAGFLTPNKPECSHIPPPSSDDAIPFSDWISIHDTAIRNATLDAIQEHAIKAGFVRYDNKGRICNYTYINPKRLLQKIESLRTQQEQP
jgi:hypothetical protein